MAIFRARATTRNTMLNVITTDMDAGAGAATLKIYTGTQPATPETGLSGNTLLGTLTFSDPSAGAASGGVLTFSAITQDSAADATGTATWGRCADSNGNAIWDADAGTSGTSIILNTASIVTGGPISITSATVTLP